MRSLFFILFFLCLTTSIGQSNPYLTFNKKQNQINKNGFLTLGTWSVINLATSGIGYYRGSGENKYFHQMNLAWSGINLGLAIPGLIEAYVKPEFDLTSAQTIRKNQKLQKIFLFNTALDIAYITTGLFLRPLSENNPMKELQIRGYANAIILQGGFLFLFDSTMYFLHNRHFKSSFNENLEIGFAPSMLQFKWYFN